MKHRHIFGSVFLYSMAIIACIVLSTLFFRLPFMSWSDDRLSLEPLHIDMQRLDLAGEPVIIDPLENPLGREKLEKELLVTRFSLYQFLLYHKRSHNYFPFIESYFREVGIPDDMKYLAVAESSLQYDALSRAGARGIWQIMPETARQYGLRVDAYIDERLHFERSTRVAAKYLLTLYDTFDNWTLAAAAYNRGLAGLQRDRESQPTAKNYYDLVLNSETGNYIYRIVAIKYLMQNRWKLFSQDVLGEVFDPPEMRIETLQGPISDLRIWCLEHDWDYQELRELNPWILSYSLPEGPWEVKKLINT